MILATAYKRKHMETMGDDSTVEGTLRDMDILEHLKYL